jgi:hypothetical protein
MIEDITFQQVSFVLFQLPMGPLGGDITGYSMDGSSYEFEQVQVINTDIEISNIFIT